MLFRFPDKQRVHLPNEKLRREGDSEYKGKAKPVVCRGVGRSDTGGRRPHVYCLGAHLHLFTALYVSILFSFSIHRDSE